MGVTAIVGRGDSDKRPTSPLLNTASEPCFNDACTWWCHLGHHCRGRCHQRRRGVHRRLALPGAWLAVCSVAAGALDGDDGWMSEVVTMMWPVQTIRTSLLSSVSKAVALQVSN